MKRTLAIALAVSSCLLVAACTVAPGSFDGVESADIVDEPPPVTASVTSAATVRLPPGMPMPFPLPTPPPPFTIESYSPATGQLRWPSNISHLQVLLQRGNGVYSNGTPVYFRAYFIGNGKHMLRALSVRYTDYGEFRSQLLEVLETRGSPADKATYGIAGSLWIGPQPGPIGDGLSPAAVSRIVRSASAVEDAADLSANYVEN